MPGNNKIDKANLASFYAKHRYYSANALNQGSNAGKEWFNKIRE
jgi:hypothetical protein